MLPSKNHQLAQDFSRQIIDACNICQHFWQLSTAGTVCSIGLSHIEITTSSGSLWDTSHQMHSMEVRRADHYLLTLFLQRCLLLVTGHHHRSLLWPMGRSSGSLAQTYCSHKQTAALIPSFLPGVVREKNNNNKKATKWTPHFAFSFKCIRWKVFHIDGLTEQQQNCNSYSLSWGLEENIRTYKSKLKCSFV